MLASSGDISAAGIFPSVCNKIEEKLDRISEGLEIQPEIYGKFIFFPKR